MNLLNPYIEFMAFLSRPFSVANAVVNPDKTCFMIQGKGLF